MTMRLGAEEKSDPPRLVIAWASRLRGNPSGSHVMNGSFDAGGWPSLLAPLPPWPVAAPYALRSLNCASPAGVIGGTGSGLLFCGPTHAPERSRLGAGPGGSGILGTPSETNPSAT